MILFLALFLVAGNASAISFGFSGNFQTSDLVGGDGFAETITFSSFFTPGQGAITSFDPNPDGVISGGDWVLIPTLTLDSTSFISGVSYDFSPTFFDNGFAVVDSANGVQITADLTVTTLAIQGQSGDINPAFSLNLTDISATANYTAGSSTIIDAFLSSPGGATQISLQFGNFPLPDSGSAATTYSGSAAPVPEPTTILISGLGLLGLGVYLRRKSKKA